MRTLRAGVTAGLVLALAACARSGGSGSAPAPKVAPTGSSSVAAASTTTALPSPATASASVSPSLVPSGHAGVLAEGVQVTVGPVQLLTLTPHAASEVAGPAAAVGVVVHNTGPDAFDLATLDVQAIYGIWTAASSTDAAPSRPLAGMLATGGTASGVYVFLASSSELVTLRVLVSSGSATSVLEFPE